MDFEIGDALGKLLRYGLVSDDGGKLSARPADDALAALDKSWDAAFAYPPA